MRARPLLALLTVPVVLLLERLTYYGVRAVLVLYMIRPGEDGGLGMTSREAMQLYAMFSAAIMLAPFFGGVAGLIAGPRLALPVGMAIDALGLGLLAFGTRPTLYLGLVALVLGQALFRTNLFTLLGQAIPGPEGNLRSGGMMLAYAAINIAAMLAPLTIGTLVERSGFGVAFALVTGIAVVATVFSVALSFIDARMATAPSPAAPSSVPGILAVGALFTLPYLASTVGSERMHLALVSLSSENRRFLFLSLNPWVVISSAGLLFVLLVVLHLQKKQVPALRLLGAGALFAMLAAVPLLLAGDALEGLVAGVVLGAVAELLIFPMAMSRISGGASPRLAPLFVGLLLSWMGVLNQVASPLAASDGTNLFLGLFALGALGIAGVLLVLGGKLERRLFAPAPAPASPAVGASLAP